MKFVCGDKDDEFHVWLEDIVVDWGVSTEANQYFLLKQQVPFSSRSLTRNMIIKSQSN